MSQFVELTEKALAGSPVMQGREKLTTEDLIRIYPQGVTVTEFDVIPNNNGGYPVFAFAEDPHKFFNGGTVAMRLVTEWLKAFDGDVTGCSEELKRCGGVKLRFYASKTKAGRNLVKVALVKGKTIEATDEDNIPF